MRARTRKPLIFIFVVALTFVGMGAYVLHLRGLLSPDILQRAIQSEVSRKAEKPPPSEPARITTSLQERQKKLDEEDRRLQELAARLEIERKEIEEARNAVQYELDKLKKPEEGGFASQENREEETEGLGSRSSFLAGTPGGRNDAMTKLIKMYEGMPPEDAAAVLVNLPDATVAQVLLRMRQRQASEILGLLGSEKATAVSRLLVSEKSGRAQGHPAAREEQVM